DSVPQDIVTQEARPPSKLNRVVEPLGGQRIFTTNVDEPLLTACCKASYRHCLNQGKGIAFHDHAILECARLRLVGVADEIAGLSRIRNRLPLSAGWES